MAPRRRAWLRQFDGGHPGRASSGTAPSLHVLAHVYYPELWPELAGRIANLREPTRLTVTLVAGSADQLVDGIRRDWPTADIRVVRNLGRDIWPTIQVLDSVRDDELVLKLHTKRSPHMRRGNAWRREMLEGLVGSAESVERVLRLFADHPDVGVLAPSPRGVLGREFLGPNRPLVEELAQRVGVRLDERALWFPAGSMFWARGEVLRALTAVGLSSEDFPDEQGQVDGTMAHAVERFLGVVAAERGLAVLEVDELPRLGL